METIQAKVEDSAAISFLSRYSSIFSMLVRKLFVDLFIKEKPIAQLKSSYQREYGVLARQFNSIASQTKGKWGSRKTQYESTIASLKARIKDVSQFVSKETKKVEKLQKKIEKTKSYREKAKSCHPEKKRKMPAYMKKLNLNVLENELAESRDLIESKTIRKKSLQEKLKKLEENLQKRRICFGGEKLFRAQFNLEKTEFESHEEWKEFWKTKRDGSCFYIGSWEEKNGNQNAQWDPCTSSLQLRAPPCLEDIFGKYMVIPLKFCEEHLNLLNEACNNDTAISFRFSKVVEKTRSGRYKKILDMAGKFLGYKTSFYCYVSFETPGRDLIVKSKEQGVVGLDINADHLAVTNTNAAGNPIAHYSIPCFIPGKTSNQNKAILGDCIANLLDYCLRVKKPLVIENLDLNNLKGNLREKGKGACYNRMLSEFQFKRIRQMILSRAKKAGVKVIGVNPAFTSVIGAYKYRGFSSMTSHQCAALVIARRGLGFREGSKIFRDMHSPDRMNELDLGPALPFLAKRKARHVWSYWRTHTRKIRETLRVNIKEGVMNDKAIYLNHLLFDPGRPSSLLPILQVFREKGKNEGKWWQQFCHRLETWSRGEPDSRFSASSPLLFGVGCHE